jgi:hypothetical protein
VSVGQARGHCEIRNNAGLHHQFAPNEAGRKLPRLFLDPLTRLFRPWRQAITATASGV